MDKEMFKGIFTPVITIFDQQGRIDFKENELVINQLIDRGVNGLLFLGSIGEFFGLTMAEKQEFIRFAIKAVDKRVPVLVGTGGTVQEEVVTLTRFAGQEGADAVVVVSPYYFKLDAATIYRYYANIARATSLPIILYNFPDRTCADLEPALVLRLAKEFRHIVGIKDTIDNISHTRKLIQTVKEYRPDFSVLSGFDEYLIPNLMAGGDGLIGGLTNVVPELFAGLLKAYYAQDLEKVTKAQAQIAVLMNLYDVSQPFIAAIKGAVAARGLAISTATKEPSVPLTQQQADAIKAILKKADVL